MEKLAIKRWEILILSLLFVLAFFLRGYALHRDLIFVYDQGRDANAVTDILHGKLPLIGPTTGLTGVFLGPLYYYFLTPLYFLGHGNPMMAAYTLVFLHGILTILIYFFGRRVGGRGVGLIAA